MIFILHFDLQIVIFAHPCLVIDVDFLFVSGVTFG